MNLISARKSDLPSPISFYLSVGEEVAFCTLHPPAPESATDTAVLLCPPFGWEEVCAYRPLRRWAEDLALAGHPTLRLSYPSTGDSGGEPRDSGRVDAWTTAISDAALWLRRSVGARRVAAIGLGFGALLVHVAAAEGAALDDLVLWACPPRGRTVLRQLRAMSKLELASCFEDVPTPEPLPDGELEAGGFLLSAETGRTLSAIDLTALSLPCAPTRRILVLDRDGLAPDRELVSRLQASGATVSIAPGDGYARMTSHPQRAIPARPVFARVREWLSEATAPAAIGVGEHWLEGEATTSVVLPTAAGPVRETVLTLPGPDGALAAILSEPVLITPTDLGAVLLNAGAVRRIGPNRMWVEAARRWASRGVPTLRLDVSGIGDADGDESPYIEDAALYTPQLVADVLRSVDELEARGIASRFVVGGLCVGGYWAFRAALQDERVCAALMINPGALVWDDALLARRALRGLFSGPVSLVRLRRGITRDRVRSLIVWLLGLPARMARRARPEAGAPPTRDAGLDRTLARFGESGKQALMMFAGGEPLESELSATGRIAALQATPTFTIERLAVHDHTLRPTRIQAQAHAALDRALDRELAATSEDHETSPEAAAVEYENAVW